MAYVIAFLLLQPLLAAAAFLPSTPPLLLPPLSLMHTPPPLIQIISPPLKPYSPTIKPPPPSSSPPLPSTVQQEPPPVIQYLPPSSPPPAREMPQDRMKNILEALIGSGDFSNWGNLLTTADPSLLPFTSTLFVPNNDVVLSSLPSSSGASGDVIDPFLFLYHIVPHRLTFADLCLFTAPNTRLPTLLPTKSILITNASSVNFTIDGARVTDPDLYSTDSVMVHGIGGLLDYRIYGGDGAVASFPWMNQSHNHAPPPMKLLQSSKGGILSSGFAALISLILGLIYGIMMIGEISRFV